MLKKSGAVLMAASLLTAVLAQSAAAQPGYDRYRQGYDNRGPAPNVNDQRQRWRQRYQREYSYQDDNYYKQCRTQVDPAGVIAGALIGGLLGNALGNRGNRGLPTIAGVVVGGALGAALTRDLNCEDQSYAYNTYYNGFNSGRTNVPYQWRNPNSGNYGEVRVDNYFNDQAGFRCANFNQQVYVNRRNRTSNGHACQQPDGTWTIVN